MARKTHQQLGERSLTAVRVPVTASREDAMTDRADRMARFAAGARRILARALTLGGVVVAGWLLALLFGASPAAAGSATAETAAAGTTASGSEAAADSRPATDAALAIPSTEAVTGSAKDGLPAPDAPVLDNTGAMAGLKVDGLTSQSHPGYPAPSTVKESSGPNGLVPNGGNGPFGPGMGDVARSAFDPRLLVQRVPLARVLPPVFRTAADDPSFSPD
ncbi:hypothetical protein [Thermoactinospora rubra]|uniref:hypothetical protein n=1 Tax=Thermoactinospora rubra TaxID=1088767 RepID=UPI001F0AAAEA|nr:hypothetical protein [Thermoactinospora rubra]